MLRYARSMDPKGLNMSVPYPLLRDVQAYCVTVADTQWIYRCVTVSTASYRVASRDIAGDSGGPRIETLVFG